MLLLLSEGSRYTLATIAAQLLSFNDVIVPQTVTGTPIYTREMRERKWRDNTCSNRILVIFLHSIFTGGGGGGGGQFLLLLCKDALNYVYYGPSVFDLPLPNG